MQYKLVLVHDEIYGRTESLQLGLKLTPVPFYAVSEGLALRTTTNKAANMPPDLR